MKALSIRQPWAEAILNLGKRVENRSWQTCHYRGPLLIHAAKGCTLLEYGDAANTIDRIVGRDDSVPSFKSLHRGGIVGVCNVVGVRYGEPDDHAFPLEGGACVHCGAKPPARGRCPKPDPWFFGPLGIVLADVRPLPFMPYKGALGFFDVPGATPEDVVDIARREGRVST